MPHDHHHGRGRQNHKCNAGLLVKEFLKQNMMNDDREFQISDISMILCLLSIKKPWQHPMMLRFKDCLKVQWYQTLYIYALCLFAQNVCKKKHIYLRNFYVKVLTRKYGAIKCTNMFVTDHTEWSVKQLKGDFGRLRPFGARSLFSLTFSLTLIKLKQLTVTKRRAYNYWY